MRHFVVANVSQKTDIQDLGENDDGDICRKIEEWYIWTEQNGTASMVGNAGHQNTRQNHTCIGPG
jgi:hypothetical protein